MWVRYSDLLQTGQSRDRIPVVARFSAPVQTGPGAHIALCIMGTRSLSQSKVAGAWHSTPTMSSSKVKERAEL